MIPAAAIRRQPLGWSSWRVLIAQSLGAGALAGLLLGSATAGVTAATIVAVVGIVWRRGEAPVLPFALAYQWVYMAVPVGFFLITGRGPLYSPVGELERAALLAMLGFLCLAAGIRLGSTALDIDRHAARIHRTVGTDLYDPMRLCLLVVALNAVDWVLEVRPAALSILFAQFLLAFFALRDVVLVALFYAVLRRRSGFLYAGLGLVSAIVPRFASVQSSFKEVLFMILITVFAEWSREHWAGAEGRKRARVLLIGAAGGAAALLAAGVVWEGAIKPVWRIAGVQGSPLEKVTAFYQVASHESSRMDAGAATERLAARLSTGIFFGYVLERVPAMIPHTGGELLTGAVWHVTHPRFLFPDKPNLGSGSERAEVYAGLTVGEDTSVSIGYMAEFYVDFGVPGMFVPILLFGGMVGVIHALAARWAPSRPLFEATVTALFVNTFLGFESNFTKMVGGMVVSAFVFLAFLVLVAPRLHRALLTEARGMSRPARTDLGQGSHPV